MVANTLRDSKNQAQAPNMLYAACFGLIPGLGHFYSGLFYSGFFFGLGFPLLWFASWWIFDTISPPYNIFFGFASLFALWVFQLVHLLVVIIPAKTKQFSGIKTRIISFAIGCVTLFFTYPMMQTKLIPKYWEIFEIPTSSMEPTLIEGDKVIVLMGNERIKRDQIIVFLKNENSEDFYIKRVIGIPGDQLMMNDKILYRNNEMVISGSVQYIDDNIYEANESPRDNFSIQLEENEFYVMGDNRDNSEDSRYFGPISNSQIIGIARTLLVYKEPDSDKIRWSRIGVKLHN